jgi:DNA segregation ATPase FtsK/SpoIIIE, S-DNA-T family
VLDVPVTVGLRESGVLGIAGPAQPARALARWILTPVAVLHSPNDVQTYLLTDAAGRCGWEWMRWLPRSRPAESSQATALVGTNTDTVTRRVAELAVTVSTA